MALSGEPQKQGSLGSLRLCALEPRDIPELRSFLAGIFEVPLDGPFLEPNLLAWKYFQPRPDWHTPRSWVFKDQADRIVAHCGIWPLHFVLPEGLEPTWHGIDFAASPTARGAGPLLFDGLPHGTRLRFGVGGTARARRVAAKIGYINAGQVDTFVRVLRPWKQLLTRPRPIRVAQVTKFIRNSVWNFTARSPLAAGWAAEPIRSFSSLRSLLGRRDDLAYTRTARTPELLDYFMACPKNCSAFALLCDKEPIGYVLFSRVSGQARIADIWIASSSERRWTEAYATAIDAAMADPRACELTAAGSTEMARRALVANGFRFVFKRPIWRRDPSGVLRGVPPLDLQAADSDAYFGVDPRKPYLT